MKELPTLKECLDGQHKDCPQTKNPADGTSGWICRCVCHVQIPAYDTLRKECLALAALWEETGNKSISIKVRESLYHCSNELVKILDKNNSQDFRNV